MHWLARPADAAIPGVSLVNNLPVAELIGSRLPNSLLLAAVTAPFSRADRADARHHLGHLARLVRTTGSSTCVTLSAVSVPEFLVATLAVLIFAVQLHWLPALSYCRRRSSRSASFFRAFAMPVLTLSCVIVAQMVRMTRAAVIDQLDAPYVEMARAEGRARRRASCFAHALPNAIGPIANAVALEPVVSARRRDHRRDDLQLSRPRQADGRRRHARATCRSCRRCAMMFCAGYLILVTIADICRHRLQPEAAPPMSELDDRPRSSGAAPFVGLKRPGCASGSRSVHRRGSIVVLLLARWSRSSAR